MTQHVNAPKKALKTLLLAGVLATSLMLVGCNGKSALLNGKVATVDGTVITKTEYDKTYAEFTKGFGLEKMPEEQRAPMTEMIRQMTLQKLIMKTLITNEADKSGLKITDADVDAYKKEKIFSNPQLKDQFQSFLKESKMTEADFNAMLKENLLFSRFMDAKGGAEVQVSEAEAKTIYQKNLAQFKLPEQIHAQHILVKAMVPELKRDLRAQNPKITDAELDKAIQNQQAAAKAEAEKLLKQVKAEPKKFEEIAKAESDDTASARNGGDLGLMAEGTTDPQFWGALQKTQPKQLYPDVVPTVFGYHIIRAFEHKPAHQASFEEARGSIVEQMSQEKKQEFLKKWTMQKRNEAKIVIEPAYQPKNADPLAVGPKAAVPVAPAAKTSVQQATKH